MNLRHLAVGILTLAGIFGSAVSANADYRADYEVSDDYMYSVNADGKTCTLQFYLGNEKDVTVPAQVAGYQVKELGLYCFSKVKKQEYASVYSMDVTKKSITIPEGVEKISFDSFNVPYLEKLVIPSTVVALRIDGGVIGNCDIQISEENPCYRFENGAVYSKDRTCLVYVKDTETFQIPDSVTVIGEYSFAKAGSLKKITVPGTVKTIDFSAFDSSNVTEIIIQQGVENIGERAFYDCSELEKMVIPSSVKSFGYACFYDMKTGASIVFYGTEQRFKELNQGEISHRSRIASLPKGTGLDAMTKVYYLTAPEMTNIVNTVKGVHVYWKGTDKLGYGYDLYRSASKNGEYVKIASTASTNYTDPKAVSGKTYFYKVKMTAAGESSDESGTKGIAFVSTPDITIRVNSINGIRLYWEKIPGATGYAIYRKGDGANDAWKRVATIPADSDLVWTDLSTKPASGNGTIFHYTVRALAGADRKTLSGCRNTGRTMVRLNKPVIYSMEKKGDGAVLGTWSRNDKATGYEVRFMIGTEVYKTFVYGKNTIVKKTITGLPTGESFKIQVRSYYKTANAGTYYSSWSDPKFVEESVWQADVPIAAVN